MGVPDSLSPIGEINLAELEDVPVAVPLVVFSA